jgi:bacteriocin-type transport-associated protein
MFDALSEITANLKSWVTDYGSEVQCDGETELITEGEQSEYLYFLVSGTAKVVTSKGNQRIDLAELAPGEMFGEMSFVENRPPVASIITSGSCRLLKVAKTKLQASVEKSNEIGTELYQLFGRKLASQLSIQNTFLHRWEGVNIEPIRKILIVFSILNEVDIEWMSVNGSRLSKAAGSKVLAEGQSVPGMIIILAGDADVLIESNGGPKLVGSSRRGEFVGEMTFLGISDKATASVVSRTDIELLEINKELLRLEFAKNFGFSYRFYKALAVLLSQRLRDQLRSKGMASLAFDAEDSDEDSMSIEQMSAVSIAGQRFEWLCQHSL